jgi:RNA polymerase sigma factor (sigma-70 family)
MAAVRDPITGTAPPPVLRGEAPAVARRDAGRETAALYRRYATTVYRYAWHMLDAREDAEDATQATFLSVHAALADGTIVREPQAWVLKIARNECLARIEARMRRPLTASLDDEAVGEVSASAPSVPRAVELRSDLAAANDALGRLPATQREAYVMREWLGLSTAEVAVSLGTTPIAVDGLLGRARRELVRVLGTSDAAGAAGCRRTCEALAAGSVDRAARAHLVRCRSCRSVRSALRPELAAARSLVPPAALAARLGDAMPGFAGAGAGNAVAGSAAGGGGLTALAAKLASGPAVIKGAAAALTAAAAVGGGVAIEQHAVPGPHPAHAITVPTQPVKAGGVPVAAGGSGRQGADMRGARPTAITPAGSRSAAASGTAAKPRRTVLVGTAPTKTRPHRASAGTSGTASAGGAAAATPHRHRGGDGGGTRDGGGGGNEAQRAEDGDRNGSRGSDGQRDGGGTARDLEGTGSGDRHGGGSGDGGTTDGGSGGGGTTDGTRDGGTDG